jgi:hypothetical protein
VFLQLTWIGLFGANTACVLLETPKLQEVFLEKLPQFSLGKNELDAATSNTDRFLSRDTCVPSAYLIGLSGAKKVYLNLENYDLQEVFLSKTNSVLIWKQYARCSCF